MPSLQKLFENCAELNFLGIPKIYFSRFSNILPQNTNAQNYSSCYSRCLGLDQCLHFGRCLRSISEKKYTADFSREMLNTFWQTANRSNSACESGNRCQDILCSKYKLVKQNSKIYPHLEVKAKYSMYNVCLC